MKTNMKATTIIYCVLFAVFVMALGALSCSRLVKYYTEDEKINNEFLPGSGSKLDNDIAGTFFGQFDFVNLNGLMARLSGERELNNVIKMDNGYLNVEISSADEEMLKTFADNVIELNDYLVRNGKLFIYIIPITTSSKFDPQMPEYYEDKGNENLDRLTEMLRNRGVYVLDMRDELASDNIDSYDMMYRTDHHWNTEMGFYTYCKLAAIMERELGCTIDPAVKDINSYTIKTYKKWHLGSRGQRTGKYFAGIDDFDLYVPLFDTHVVTSGGEKEGGYMDLLINNEPLEKKDLTSTRDDINIRSIYDRVLEASLGDYENRLSCNDKRILVIGDSFTKAVMPFIDISFARTHWEYGPVSRETMEELQPDAVIMLYDVSPGKNSSPEEYDWTRE